MSALGIARGVLLLGIVVYALALVVAMIAGHASPVGGAAYTVGALATAGMVLGSIACLVLQLVSSVRKRFLAHG